MNHTPLSRANDSRDYRILKGLGTYLIGLVRSNYSKVTTIDNVIYAVDYTTISTSIKLAPWALDKYSKGAVKMHSLFYLWGSILANIHITVKKIA